MELYSQEELKEALRAIVSLQSKLGKAIEKLEPGKSQHTLAKNRLKALGISRALLEEKLASLQ